MPSLATRTAATAGQIAGGDFLYVLNAAGSTEYKVTRDILLTGLTANPGGDINVKGGAASSGNNNGGNILLLPGAKAGSGADGYVIVRQPGGVAGTNEAQILHDGNDLIITNMRNSGNPFKFTSGAKITANSFQAYGGSVSFDSSNSTRLEWVVNGVLQTNGTANGWLQNKGGTARVTADVTNATTSLSSLSDLTVTLISGRKYVGVVRILGTDSTGADGIKFAMDGGTATFTDIEFGFTGTPTGATVGTASSAAVGTAITCSAVATSDAWFDIAFSCTCNAGGTLIPRFAQNAHSAGTATARKGSQLILCDSPN